MPRVLLVSTAYPPPSLGGTARLVKLLRWLPKCGWDPTLLTVSRVPLAPGAQRLPDDSMNVWRIGTQPWRRRVNARMALPASDGNRAKRTGGRVLGHLKSALRRPYCNFMEFPDEMWQWIRPGARLGTKLLESDHFDLIYSSAGAGVSGHFVARRIQRRTGVPWVHEYRDLWARNPWRLTKAYRWREWLELYWERRFVAESYAVAVVHERIAEILRARLPAGLRDRVTVVPNGFDPVEFDGGSPPPVGLPLRLCYTGLLYGGKRDLSGLFRAIQMLLQSGRANQGDLEFVYAGSDTHVVGAVASRFGLVDMVRALGSVPADEAKRIQLSSHVLVLVEAAEDDPWVRGNMPGKAYEYLGAERPVLALAHPEGSIAELYSATQAGVTLHPNDSEGIAQFLQTALEAIRTGKAVPYEPDRNAVKASSWEAIGARLATLLDKVVRDHALRGARA